MTHFTGTFELNPPGWDEQWRRLVRARDRLHDGTYPEQTFNREIWEDYLDLLVAVFTASLHMSDWLANDDQVTQWQTVGEVRASVQDRWPLMDMCDAFANGIKHMRLQERKGRDSTTGIRKGEMFLVPGAPGEGFCTVRFYVTDSAKEFGAYWLARSCVSWWALFLNQKGLLSQPDCDAVTSTFGTSDQSR